MAKQTLRFIRAGGCDQVRIETGADILALADLDQKLWVALACPVEGLEFDPRTLRMLDRDGSGRVRAADILREISWLKQVLKDPEELVRPGDDLALSAIDDEAPEGKQVLASARRILGNLGKADRDCITLTDALDTENIFNSTSFNGDGVVPVEAAQGNPPLMAVIEDILTCQGAATDRSGAPGVTQETADAFFDGIGRHADWLAAGQGLAGTEEGAKALLSVRDQIDGFFLRCRLAAYRPAAADILNPGKELLGQLADKGLADSMALLTNLPLAEIGADSVLPLGRGANPAWHSALASLKEQTIKPLLGDRDQLTADDWESLCQTYQPRLEWMAARPQSAVDQLGDARIQAVHDLSVRSALNDLINSDKALEHDVAAFQQVERLIRLRLGMHRLVNNFISFRDFYAGKSKAVFLAGTLYLDGRSADLCIRVGDPAAHAPLAMLSRMYLVYCACQRKGQAGSANEKMTIVAAFTDGDSDQLMVGRNGVFYGRDGRDWDATVVKIVEHPISLRQAFWSPYKKFAKMINDQVEKLATLHSAQSPLSGFQLPVPAPTPGAAPAAAAPAKPAAVAPAPAAAAAPFDVGRFAGIFAAIGLAVGAIGTAIASVVTGFLSLSWWQMPLALVGLLLAISGPALVIAYLKLRHRNLAPVLDATGWAVNARVRINIPFGNSLTTLARLPEGAERTLTDPFAEKKQPWGFYLFLAGVVLVALGVWRSGLLARFL